MGHPYRERHSVATTTTDNLGGLGAPATDQASWTDDNTLEQLREAAKKQGLAVSGNKAELIDRLNNGETK